MRRFTMTPNSRSVLKVPSSVIKSTPFPRQSIAVEECKRRDIKLVRDKNYKQQCVDTVLKFLSENGYENGLSQKILHNPSSKDFQLIFKFLYSFIDDFNYTARFEDDVVNIIRNLKYPYSGEITKSQITAITPHTWPVVLSMLSWLVELIIHCSSMLEEEAEESIEKYFLDFVCDGYLQFMEGNENDTVLEELFERRVTDMYTEIFNVIDAKKIELEKIEQKIAQSKAGFDDRNRLEKRKKELADDFNMLLSSEKQLEGKKIKYLNYIEKIQKEIENAEDEIEDLRKQQNDLKKQISRQKINPEDIKGMNVEKVELFKELERLKPEKEKLLKYVSQETIKLQERVEELEKLLFDLSNVRPDISLRVIKETRIINGIDDFVFKIANTGVDSHTLEGGIRCVTEALDDELNSKRESLVTIEIGKSVLEEKINEKQVAFEDLNKKFAYNNEKLVTTGKLYLEKKEISENEQRKSKTEMEVLENELLKLNLESNTSLLMSEQSLQKVRINLDRTLNSISYEKEEINKLVFNFCSMVENLNCSIQSQINEMKSLLN